MHACDDVLNFDIFCDQFIHVSRTQVNIILSVTSNGTHTHTSGRHLSFHQHEYANPHLVEWSACVRY